MTKAAVALMQILEAVRLISRLLHWEALLSTSIRHAGDKMNEAIIQYMRKRHALPDRRTYSRRTEDPHRLCLHGRRRERKWNHQNHESKEEKIISPACRKQWKSIIKILCWHCRSLLILSLMESRALLKKHRLKLQLILLKRDGSFRRWRHDPQILIN